MVIHVDPLDELCDRHLWPYALYDVSSQIKYVPWNMYMPCICFSVVILCCVLFCVVIWLVPPDQWYRDNHTKKWNNHGGLLIKSATIKTLLNNKLEWYAQYMWHEVIMNIATITSHSFTISPSDINSLSTALVCLLWAKTLIYLLPQSLKWCMQYSLIFDRVIMVLHCIKHSNKHYPGMNAIWSWILVSQYCFR